MAKKQYLSVRPYTPRNLPDGYTQALYIESTGTQYIDTGFAANQNTTAKIKFSTTQQSGGGVLVAMQGWRNRGYGVFVNAVLFGASGYDKTGLFGDGAIHDVTLNSNAQCYDNGNLIWTGSVSTYTTPATLTICKSNVIDESHEYSKAKIYSCLIYDNDALARDYIPCVIDATGEYGLYDFVTQKFYGNKGTGAFSGLRLAKLPEGYTQVEHISSSGTQYIDTGVIPNQDTKMALDCDITYGSGWTMIAGTYESGAWFSWWSTGTNVEANYVTSAQKAAGITGRGTLIADKNVWLIGGAQLTFTKTNFAGSRSVYLFSVNGGSGVPNSTMKLYASQLYDNGTLVRDYVPCITSAGVVGLYDLVTNAFYGNAGTGTFAYGEIIGTTFREVKKRYLTIGNTHHKVKKGYLTIGGVYRPFVGGGEPVYFGTVTPLNAAKYEFASASVGDYAIFYGGQNTDRYTIGKTTTVYRDSVIYNSSFTQTIIANDATGRGAAAATTTNYAVFSGGTSSTSSETSGTTTTYAYDKELTKITPTGGQARHCHAGLGVGGTSIFQGGYSSQGYLGNGWAYDSTLTRIYSGGIGEGSWGLKSSVDSMGVSSDLYGIYAHGASMYGVAINEALTSTRIDVVGGGDSCRQYLGGAGNSKYCLFASAEFSCAYDNSLTKHTLPVLGAFSTGSMGLPYDCYRACALGEEYFVFLGKGGTAYMFDDSLTATIINSSLTYDSRGGAVTVGTVGIFASAKAVQAFII